jgi:endonuclease/exonuclease/phosphatase (EEP) superfamily protein YafD
VRLYGEPGKVRHPELVLRRTADDYQPPEIYEPFEDEEEEKPGRWRIGGRKTTIALYGVALFFLAVAVLRFLGIDGNPVTVPAVALVPYVAAGGIVLGPLCFFLRRRLLAIAVLLMALVLTFLLLPRMVGNDQPDARGQHVRVMAANLNDGKADPVSVVNLVRANRVDVLALPELSHAEVPRLDAAGIAAELPYRVLDPSAGGDGSGILSRFPLRQTALVEALELSMPSAVVDLPDRADTTHVQSALHGSADVWRRDLGRLPSPQRERVRVLAGDFNSTFDHAAFRAVLDRGYADAAEQTGRGLIPTWTSWGPPITIDHVLVDNRCAVRDYSVHDLAGSDHNAVFADLQLP